MTIVDTTTGEVLTGEVIEEMTEPEARQFVQRINHSVSIAGDLIIEAYERRIWKSLGYGSWGAFAEAEIGGPEMTAAARAVLVVGLRQAGMSLRAIEASTGVSRSQVQRITSGVPNGTPDEVVGMDGKPYPSSVTRRETVTEKTEFTAPAEGAGGAEVGAATDGDRSEPAPEPVGGGGVLASESTEAGSPSGVGPTPPPTLDPEVERLRFLASIAKAAEKSHELFIFDAAEVARVNDPMTDTTVRQLLATAIDWFEAYEKARPTGLRVVEGGA